MPGVEMPARLETSDEVFEALDKNFRRQERFFRWIATRNKPNMIYEGNNGFVDANSQIELLVYKPPVGLRLLINRLIINADGLTPGAGKYTNAGAYWQLFDGPGRNQMSMPDFGPLDGSVGGASQLPLVNQYGTKGLIFEQNEVRVFLNLPAIGANKNVVVMFTGWLEPPYPDTE